MSVKHDILATLTYFDIFDYPLTQTEIAQFLPHSFPNETISEALCELMVDGWIFRLNEFYALQDDYALVIRRRNGNSKARKLLLNAESIAGVLSAFPFVRGIGISGSLSKNFADENARIDFFIITAKNRVWLARTFLFLFKKLSSLVKDRPRYSMNYFISEGGLQIKEKNIFTATELVTLLPLRGINCFQQFYSQNKWSAGFLPNHTMRVSYVKATREPFFKKLVELLFSNPIGSLLDYLLMKLASLHRLKGTRKHALGRMIKGMDASRQYAKPDPQRFQKSLMFVYEKRIASLFRRYEGKSKSIY